MGDVNTNYTAKDAFLFVADKGFDHLPGLSTVNNTVDLFMKCVVIPLIDQEKVENSHHLTYIKNKDLVTTILLLIPFLGNIYFLYHEYKTKEIAQNVPKSLLSNDAADQLKALHKEPIQLRRPEPLEVHIPRDNRKFFVKNIFHNTLEQLEGKTLESDKVLIKEALKKYPSLLSFLPKEIKENQSFILELVKENGISILGHITFNDDPGFMLACLEIDKESFKHMSHRLWENVDYIHAALLKGCFDIQSLWGRDALIDHSPLMLDALKINKKSYQYAGEKLKENPTYMLEAYRKGCYTFSSLEAPLADNADFILKILKITPTIYRDLDDKFKQNKDFMLKAVDSGAVPRSKLNKKWKDDPDVKAVFFEKEMGISKKQLSNDELLKALIEQPSIFSLLNADLQANQAFILQAIEKNVHVLEHAPRSLLFDPKFMIQAIEINKDAFKYVYKVEEFCLAAMKESPLFFDHIPDNLKKNRRFLFDVLREQPGLFRRFDPSFKDDNELFLAAVEQQAIVISAASPRIQHDKKLIKFAIRRNLKILAVLTTEQKIKLKINGYFFVKLIKEGKVEALEYLSETLKNNQDFKKEVIGLDSRAAKYFL